LRGSAFTFVIDIFEGFILVNFDSEGLGIDFAMLLM